MRVVLDGNVVMSGLFFGAILEARYKGVEFDPFAALLVLNSQLLDTPEHFSESVAEDPDDDKFLACALAANASSDRFRRLAPPEVVGVAWHRSAEAQAVRRALSLGLRH